MKPGQITEDQSAAIAFLSNAATHDGIVPERIDTHAAIIFLAGDRAWKLKRAVRYPFLDFSTVDKRRAACQAELRLNRRTAPDIYLDCLALTRGPDGALEIGGGGAIVDWVVAMRRFDEACLFSRMADDDTLTERHILELADCIAVFHNAAEIRRDHGGAGATRWIVEDNIDEMAGQPRAFPPERIARLRDRSRRTLERIGPLLDRRREAGFVRHCHGDLHLRNICLWQGRPTLFDCLEFDERLSCIDVLYDLAFLLMDLVHRGHRDYANLAFNRYIQRTGDLSGLAALPLFLSCRAAIRAKVEASAIAHQPDDANRNAMQAAALGYLDQALQSLEPGHPWLIAIAGESGSGKSTVARLVAPHLDGPAGALILRSDVIRKHLFKRRMEDRLPQEAYDQAASDRTYAQIVDDARAALAAGMTVIADAVYARPGERDALEAAAAESGVPFAGFWLDAPLDARMARVGVRRNDASDATADMLRRFPRRETGSMRWTRIAAAGPPNAAVRDILANLASRRNA